MTTKQQTILARRIDPAKHSRVYSEIAQYLKDDSISFMTIKGKKFDFNVYDEFKYIPNDEEILNDRILSFFS
jgi:hypothetical protein